jgi:hypothetical protein
MSNRAVFLRLIFAACAVLVSLAMLFRPIPSITAANDTGRYVANQLQACSLPALEDDSGTMAERAFYLLMRPTCLGGTPRIFLFCVAMAVPVALLVFANWNREGTLLLASGMLISTVGFEFMTNAMRQGASMFFLLGGFYFKKRLPKIAFVVTALLLHDSSWFFAPLVILLAYGTGGLRKKTILLWAIPVLAGAGYLFTLRFLSENVQLSTLFGLYSERYTEQLSMPFLLYIILPLFLVFGLRNSNRKDKPSKEERIVFWYSAALLALSIVIFPSITYRFAMTGITLQLFMAMRSSKLSVLSSASIGGAFIAHFMIYVFISKNVMAVIHG